jgi:toxin-antitoxin system PIN domain toxin
LSYALDTNILLYASNVDCDEHTRARTLLERCVASGELLCLPWPVLMAYLRISTHSRIFRSPLSFEQATSNIESLLALPHVRPLSELEGFWEVFRKIGGKGALRGNGVPDAHIAALLWQHGVKTLFTNDADFRRFEFLEVRNPLE